MFFFYGLSQSVFNYVGKSLQVTIIIKSNETELTLAEDIVSPLTHHGCTNYPPVHQNLCVMFGSKIKTIPEFQLSIYNPLRPASGTPLSNYELIT